MVRRTLALVTMALALTVACGTGDPTSGSDTPVSNRSSGGPAPATGPGAGGTGPDPRCRGVQDLPVGVTAVDGWLGPRTEITPDCSGIDPELFRAETSPTGPIGSV